MTLVRGGLLWAYPPPSPSRPGWGKWNRPPARILGFFRVQFFGQGDRRRRRPSGLLQWCQSALNSFQVTASKSFQLVSLISPVFCVA